MRNIQIKRYQHFIVKKSIVKNLKIKRKKMNLSLKKV
jgi:hypothetical protein